MGFDLVYFGFLIITVFTEEITSDLGAELHCTRGQAFPIQIFSISK